MVNEERSRAQAAFVRAATGVRQGSTTTSACDSNTTEQACPAFGASGAPPATGTEGNESANPFNRMPTAIDATPTLGTLDTRREASTIPVADASALPRHQEVGQDKDGKPTWLYPSQQMFFNAMKRKGWNPSEGDMKAVVSIHNAVNERAWQHVLEWERLHAGSCPQPRLIRFQGKPKQYSPRALLLNALGYSLPFDRHDWYVDRCGREVRYVIDFYNAKGTPGAAPAAMYLDVRPALDSVGALVDRARVALARALAWL